MNYEFHRLREVLVHVRVSPARVSLSSRHISGETLKGMSVLEVLAEKKLLSPGEQRQMRSFIYYTQAGDNLFQHHAPFRRLLWMSILAGRPPIKRSLHVRRELGPELDDILVGPLGTLGCLSISPRH